MKQQEIDFDFAERDALLSAVQFKSNMGVTQCAVAAVLNRIAQYYRSKDGCWIKTENIAALAKLTEKQVTRALHQLRAMDLIYERKIWHQECGKSLVHRFVNWENINRQLASQQRPTSISVRILISS